MTHKLLTTTALIALLTSTAVADNHTILSTDLNADSATKTTIETDGTSVDATTDVDVNAQVGVEAEKSDTETDATMKAKEVVTDAATKPSNAVASSTKSMDKVAVSMSGEAVLASNLIGKKVYGSATTDAEVYGDVNDIVMDANGNAEWVIVGVGGFLGLGEKEVALSIEQIDWVDRDGERVVITNATKAELEAAANLDRDALVNNEEFKDNEFSWTDEGKKRIDDMKNWDWEHAQLKTVAYADVSAGTLLGARVTGPDREDVGEIGDVLLSSENEVTAYIVDVGGFLGLGEKPVALSTNRIHIYQNAEGDLSVRSDFTKEELENSQVYVEAEYKEDPEKFILQ
ncbi:PRC-barrel domain-containing protein [Maritalea sp.]|uniref:PRC-barrel domain-containing protein n=1 Tax=Maritalea sp. TaxID=2003361 RepID=UPI003EF6EE1D